jgi:hypothetical protein
VPIVYDFAVGFGAIWAAGEVCRRRPIVWLIDPAGNEI